MEYNLKDLKMIAQGGQAEIYDIGDNKLLRVLINPNDEKFLKNEMETMNELKKSGICVPEVYEYLKVDNRPALVIEKISGDSLLIYLMKHPFKIKKEIQSFAALHVEISKISPINNLYKSKVRAKYLIERSDLPDTELKNFVLNLLDDLPEGNSICHGDFHPGNILRSGDKNYIIDWFGAYSGNILCDAAHTYILMKNVPRLPGASNSKYKIMKFMGNMLASEYINTFYKLYKFNWGEFSKWMVVMAAERTNYGMQSEKPALVKFIRCCCERSNNGVSAEKWYKKF